MSCHNHSWRSANGGQSRGPWGCGGRAHWKPLELAAVIFGFLVFWPLGLALLLIKLWQRNHGSEEDMFAFARDQARRFREGWSFQSSDAGAATSWSSMRSTGNSAFDEWRKAELERLEEERRKLAEAERAFSEHIDQLRRARDREEFDSFMKARKGS